MEFPVSGRYWSEIERGGRPAYWNESGLIHQCTGAEGPPGIFVAWTLCSRDVPNGGLYVTEGGEERVSCPNCRAARHNAQSAKAKEPARV